MSSELGGGALAPPFRFLAAAALSGSPRESHFLGSMEQLKEALFAVLILLAADLTSIGRGVGSDSVSIVK